MQVDPATGEITQRHALPAEPGDILIKHNGGRAYVSCSGADAVVKVNLATNAVEQTFSVQSSPSGTPPLVCEQPLFLSFDAQSNILVAPLLSGC